MKFSYLAAMAITGAAAAAIAVAPAASAAIPATDIPAGATITQRDGHVSVDATPPTVSEPRSYGEFSSPAPFFGN